MNFTSSTVSPAGSSGNQQPLSQHASREAQEFVGESRERMSGDQLTLDVAVAAGEAGMAQAIGAAERRDPDFSRKAEAAIVASLHSCKQRRASSEDLVDAARAAGLNPKDDRAFGPVFQSMARRGVIRFVGHCLRKKGHGTAGGRVWALCL